MGHKMCGRMCSAGSKALLKPLSHSLAHVFHSLQVCGHQWPIWTHWWWVWKSGKLSQFLYHDEVFQSGRVLDLESILASLACIQLSPSHTPGFFFLSLSVSLLLSPCRYFVHDRTMLPPTLRQRVMTSKIFTGAWQELPLTLRAWSGARTMSLARMSSDFLALLPHPHSSHSRNHTPT